MVFHEPSDALQWLENLYADFRLLTNVLNPSNTYVAERLGGPKFAVLSQKRAVFSDTRTKTPKKINAIIPHLIVKVKNLKKKHHKTNFFCYEEGVLCH